MGGLAGAVRSVNAGEVHVAPSLASGLLCEMSRPRPVDPLAELSPRDRQKIGLKLGLAEKTIKHYMTNILQKLHVRSRVEAALLAAKAGLSRGDLGPR